MTKKLPASYLVVDGENVTLRLVMKDVHNGATLSLNGIAVNAIPTDPDKYQFTITGIPGKISVLSFDGVFPDGTPDDAEYDLFLQGDKGGPEFTGPVGINAGGTAEIDIRFKVVAA